MKDLYNLLQYFLPAEIPFKHGIYPRILGSAGMSYQTKRNELMNMTTKPHVVFLLKINEKEYSGELRDCQRQQASLKTRNLPTRVWIALFLEAPEVPDVLTVIDKGQLETAGSSSWTVVCLVRLHGFWLGRRARVTSCTRDLHNLAKNSPKFALWWYRIKGNCRSQIIFQNVVLLVVISNPSKFYLIRHNR